MATIGKAILSPIRALGSAVGDSPSLAKTGRNGQITAPADELATITQPDSPGQQSAQNYETVKEEEMTFAAPTTIQEVVHLSAGGQMTRTINVPAGSKRLLKESQKVGQTLGASQKPSDTGAILGSFKWVQGLGVITLLIGAIGFAHPAARILIGGKDTAVVISLVGVGMIAGPFLLVQYADWFALGILAAAAYWFFSRSKHKEGQLDALKEKGPSA